jgi:hypothetical protein
VEYYDHGLVGATLGVASGIQRRYGWAAVMLAALAAMFPDWDAATKRTDPAAYQRGHRVWGHNLFAVTAAGLALGGLGYLIHRSRSARPDQSLPSGPGGLGPWLVLWVAVMLSHPLLDLLYCGWGRDADWPVGLLWPIGGERYAVPWMPWSDWGATVILSIGMCVTLAVRRYRQLVAVLALAVLAIYVAIRGALLQWG